MKKASPRERYGDMVRDEVFGTEHSGIRSAVYLSRMTGINVETLRSWKRDPGRMPAYRYLQIKKIIEQ